jgi:methylmalonyl-CoA decarboxylase
MPLIQKKLDGKIGTIALDHYEKRNALGSELIAEVVGALNEFKGRDIRALVVRSATSGTVWSAGRDVTELPKADVDPFPYTDPFEQLLRAVREFPAPVLAMIHGTVWGAACELVLNCDLVFADETCTFAITPAKMGLPYTLSGLLTFMARVPLGLTKEMFFTAEPISVERAERAGLVNQIVPAAQLESTVYDNARTIATRSPASIRASKEAIRVLSDAVAINPATYEYLQSLRREVYFGMDYREGIQAFLEKRPPKF